MQFKLAAFLPLLAGAALAFTIPDDVGSGGFAVDFDGNGEALITKVSELPAAAGHGAFYDDTGLHIPTGRGAGAGAGARLGRRDSSGCTDHEIGDRGAYARVCRTA